MHHRFSTDFTDSVLVEELDEIPEEFRDFQDFQEFQPTEPVPLNQIPDPPKDFWANSEFADDL